MVKILEHRVIDLRGGVRLVQNTQGAAIARLSVVPSPS